MNMHFYHFDSDLMPKRLCFENASPPAGEAEKAGAAQEVETEVQKEKEAVEKNVDDVAAGVKKQVEAQESAEKEEESAGEIALKQAQKMIDKYGPRLLEKILSYEGSGELATKVIDNSPLDVAMENIGDLDLNKRREENSRLTRDQAFAALA